MTVIATAHALQWQQITPIFCDIDPDTHLIDPDKVERLITERTTGILGVHLWGRTCDIDALSRISNRHGLQLMFDAAHSFGCSHGGRMVGGFGRAEVFSFHATKFFNSFEGGAITTNDDALAAKIRLMTNFGFAGYDKVVNLGTNAKMCEMAAAMGLASLRSLDDFVAVNRRNYQAYERFLAGVPTMRLIEYNNREHCNYQYIVAEYTPRSGGATRDDLVKALWAENVMARRYFWPGCHRMEPYRTLYPQAVQGLPHTDTIAAKLLVLPTGTAVSVEEIELICGLIELVVREGRQLREHLAAQFGDPGNVAEGG